MDRWDSDRRDGPSYQPSSTRRDLAMNSKSPSFAHPVIRTAVLALALLGATAALADAAAGHRRASVRGTISAVDATAGTLTIAPRHGNGVTLHTDAQTRL